MFKKLKKRFYRKGYIKGQFDLVFYIKEEMNITKNEMYSKHGEPYGDNELYDLFFDVVETFRKDCLMNPEFYLNMEVKK